MITKMKKISFLVFHREYDAFLEDLRQLGVVHVVERQQGISSDAGLRESMRVISKEKAVLAALEPYADSAQAKADAASTVKAYDEFLAWKTQAEQKLQSLEKSRSELSVWGDFRYESLERLKTAGYLVSFFSCAPKNYNKEWEKLYHATVIYSDKQKVCFITVTPCGQPLEIDADVCHLPQRSLSEIVAESESLTAELASADDRLKTIANCGVDALRKSVAELSSSMDVTRVRLSGQNAAEDRLLVLDGWIPASESAGVEKSLDRKGVFFTISDPTPEDDIPIQLNNNRFARLFEPLTRLYMLPTYQELDLTLFFAPFFMLFFGLCLGDIGYGLLMIVALPIFTKLFKLINPDFSKGLVVLFGASTILCGLLSGTFFGFNIYNLNIGFVQKMKEFLFVDSSAMFSVSLCIGVVQILFGMGIKAVNLTIQCGFKYALSTIGWLLLLLTVIGSVLTGVGFSNPIVLALMGIAAVGIFLLNSPGKNPLLNIGLGLWDTYNMATGLLGDVLSYVRLFALGLSGGILANVFNSMATGMSPDVPVVGFLVTALIFLLGHALNIFMNILGAVVHPMRLTFVEFFKNSGYAGGGTEYRPFAKSV